MIKQVIGLVSIIFLIIYLSKGKIINFLVTLNINEEHLNKATNQALKREGINQEVNLNPNSNEQILTIPVSNDLHYDKLLSEIKIKCKTSDEILPDEVTKLLKELKKLQPQLFKFLDDMDKFCKHEFSEKFRINKDFRFTGPSTVDIKKQIDKYTKLASDALTSFSIISFIFIVSVVSFDFINLFRKPNKQIKLNFIIKLFLNIFIILFLLILVFMPLILDIVVKKYGVHLKVLIVTNLNDLIKNVHQTDTDIITKKDITLKLNSNNISFISLCIGFVLYLIRLFL